jgi:hypothetical protein
MMHIALANLLGPAIIGFTFVAQGSVAAADAQLLTCSGKLVQVTKAAIVVENCDGSNQRRTFVLGAESVPAGPRIGDKVTVIFEHRAHTDVLISLGRPVQPHPAATLPVESFGVAAARPRRVLPTLDTESGARFVAADFSAFRSIDDLQSDLVKRFLSNVETRAKTLFSASALGPLTACALTLSVWLFLVWRRFISSSVMMRTAYTGVAIRASPILCGRHGLHPQSLR